jgi:hypothetical protein
MDFLRLYLGEITGLALVVLTVFVASAIAIRRFPNRTTAIKITRSICLAAAVGGFAASLVPSLALNQPLRGRIDRSAADQDQRAFELRHRN